MDTFLGAPRYATTNPPEAPGTNGLARHLCQVTGLNQNYTSHAGTLYHVQIEDRGPVVDRVSEQEVRRVNMIVYANYGEANARIVYGHDYDFPDVRSQEHMMGDVFASADLPSLHVKLAGTAKFSKVVIIKDNQYVYSTEPHSDKVEFSWRDNAPVKGKTSYYYVRGEQDNGEIVWVSPMWITYTRK